MNKINLVSVCGPNVGEKYELNNTRGDCGSSRLKVIYVEKKVNNTNLNMIENDQLSIDV